MRLIDADALIERMYHDAFETDTDMQKWDSGCWIRYKMFENAMDSAPTVDAVEVVRCENCRHDNNCEIQYAAQAGSKFFCAYGKRREESEVEE